MARRVFTEVPYQYADGKFGVAVGQTRGGVEELVSLSGNMVFDEAASLWLPVSASNPLPATLSGSIVEQVDGADAIRTKQAALAYASWDFNNQYPITVGPGASVEEAVAHKVNGFATLAVIARCIDGTPSYLIEARWRADAGSGYSDRSTIETVGQNQTGVATAYGAFETKSQYVALRLTNNGTQQYDFFVHALLRA